jgi:hypothetical protein
MERRGLHRLMTKRKTQSKQKVKPAKPALLELFLFTDPWIQSAFSFYLFILTYNSTANTLVIVS